jgi:autotransporter-associated beta strand protein
MPLDTQAHPRHRSTLSKKILLGIAASLATASAANAAGGTWLGAAGSDWSNTSNWSANPVPGAGDTATFNGAGNANTTLDLGAGVTIGSVVFDTASAAAYTIGSGGAGSQTLTLGTAGNAITINSTVAANQAFNANLALSTTGNYTFTNDSTTNGLTLAGGIGASTTGAKILTVSGAGNTTVSGAIADGSGQVALTKSGAGTLTLSGANTSTGAIVVAGGTLVISNTVGTNTTNNNFKAGSVANIPATLKIASGANAINRFNLFVGDAGAGTGGGAVYQSGGALTLTQAASTDNLRIGSNAGGYGYYQFSGGTLTSNELSVGGSLANTIGVMDVSGGSVTSNGWIVLGRGGQTSSGVLNVTGGTVEFSKVSGAADANNSRLGLQWGNSAGAQSVVNIANGSVTGDDYIDLAVTNTAGTLGAINLLAGGLLQGSRVTAAAGNPTALLNFNGGTLRANSTNAGANFLVSGNVDAVTVYGGGGTIDNNGTNITVSRALAGATDSGVTAIAVTDGGSGYIGAPLVKITGGTGNPATGYAVMVDDGTGKGTYKVGSIVITNPGTYSVAPTAVTLSGGGAVTAATIGSITTGANSSAGGMTFSGSGTTTISGVNTYTGNTTVNDGSLVLADNASLKFVIGANGVNNKVTGNGTITIDGDFAFDLAGASTTLGHAWQIVDVSTLNESFGATFTVSNFTLDDSKWVRPVNGAFYEFDPATGVLRVINDPDFVYPPPTVAPVNQGTSYATGTDIVLSVSATGFGSLTYQWYLDTGSGPQAISGATGATLTVSNATAANGGIYSVIVTDHAAEASGKPATTTTVTFSPITVQPANELAVSYYRFEDGTNGANVSPALDSVGGSNLNLLGTATYTNATPFYTVIPATGAANALGANFPATGNNGLVAPNTGALADTAFTNFTIEAMVRFSDVGGIQTIVGRDDATTGVGTGGQGLGGQALFYLSKDGAAKFRVEVITKDNRNVQINSQSTAAIGTWYHVAVVGNAGAGTLKLYVNGTEVGSVTGFNGLFVPSTGSDTPWTVGRGDFNLGDTDFFRGDVDEVRITRAALAPGQFLNSSGGVAVIPPTASISPSYTSVYPGANVVFTATASSNMGGTLSYQWYKDGVALSGETGTTLSRSSVTLGSNGVYSVVVTDSAGASLSTTATVRLRVLDVPASGTRSIGLNFVGAATGTNNWSKELGIMSASQSAGIYAMANWNNSASVTGVAVQTTPLALAESNTSTAAAVTATWSAVGAWSAQSGTGIIANNEKTPDALLLHGYIESRLAAGSSVTVSNIPYASYDVYIHVAGGANGEVGSLKINREGSPTYYYRVFQHDSYVPATAPTALAPYTVPVAMGESLTRSEALATAPATFVRFAGVTGYELTITAIDSVLNRNAGGIAAIEIVDRTPAGTAYPVIVTSAPASKMVRGGTNVSFAVTANSQNSGTLSYQWQKDGSDLSGQTGATLNLSNVTGASTGTYSVVITDNSSLGATSTTRSASLVVVDATRPLLINGDLNSATTPTFMGNGILRTTGSSNTDLGVGTTVWNGVLGAAGTATRSLAKDSTGLTLPGVNFTYAGAEGLEDNTAAGFISGTAMEALSRDYLYTDNQTTPLTGSISGLDALVGYEVTLVVYAYGKLTTAFNQAATSDTATVTLATANNHLGGAPFATSTGSFEGRNIVDNNLISTSGATSAYATFTGVVAPGGTVNWSIGPDSDAGRIPLVGFQLLVTGNSLAPAVPTGLAAVGGNNQVSLTWNAVSGADTYTIGRSTTSGGPYTTISAGLVTGTSYTDNSAVNGTTYYYVVASAKTSPAVQSAYSAQVSATPANATPLQSWRQTHFGTTANSGNAANTADPDGDGLVNLLEYALGTNPTVAAASPVTLGQSGGTLTLTFSPVVDANLSYAIEASNDLTGAWSVVHTYGSFASTAPVTYTDSVVLSTVNSKRFLRLKVTSTE